MKIFVTRSAYSDLESIREHYEKEGVPHVGEKFIAAILDHVQTLVDHPDIGRVVPEFEDNKVRELIHAPFRIVYFRERESVHIVRVSRSERILHLSRNNET